MKHKKIIIWSAAAAAVAIIGAISTVLYLRYGRLTPDLIMNAETVGSSSEIELIWEDCYRGSVRLTDNGQTVAEQKLDGSKNGTVTFPSQPVGSYAVELISSFGKVLDSEQLTVTDSRIFAEQTVTQVGDATAIRILGEDLGEDAWIGIYERGKTPGVDDSFLWQPVSDSIAGTSIYYPPQMRGSINLFNRYAGQYTAYLFADEGYTILGSWDFETQEDPDTLAMRWEPNQEVSTPGDSYGQVVLVGRPSSPDKESLWICWGSDNQPLKGYEPLFCLNAYDHYPVSGQISACSVFPEGATQLLACADDDGKPGEVMISVSIQPELRHIETEEPNFSFAAISDTHVTGFLLGHNNWNYFRALNQIMDVEPAVDLIINNGDITDNGSEKEYRVLNQIEGLIRNLPPVYYSIGNHDSDKNRSDFEQLRTRFLEQTGTDEVYYSFVENGCTFIILGNEGAVGSDDPDYAYLSETQLEWLDQTLSEAEGFAFVFVHQPLFETVAATYEVSDLSASDEVKEIVSKYPNTLVISGHTHRSLSGTVALVKDGNAGYLHDGVVCAVWDGVQDTDDSQGLILSVYDDHLLIEGRSFEKDAWLPLCSWRIGLDSSAKQ